VQRAERRARAPQPRRSRSALAARSLPQSSGTGGRGARSATAACRLLAEAIAAAAVASGSSLLGWPPAALGNVSRARLRRLVAGRGRGALRLARRRCPVSLAVRGCRTRGCRCRLALRPGGPAPAARHGARDAAGGADPAAPRRDDRGRPVVAPYSPPRSRSSSATAPSSSVTNGVAPTHVEQALATATMRRKAVGEMPAPTHPKPASGDDDVE